MFLTFDSDGHAAGGVGFRSARQGRAGVIDRRTNAGRRDADLSPEELDERIEFLAGAVVHVHRRDERGLPGYRCFPKTSTRGWNC